MTTERMVEDLPADVQKLLDLERVPLRPPDGARERVRSRVAVTVGLAAGASAAVGVAKAAPGVSAAVASTSLVVKVLAPVGVGLLIAGGLAMPRLFPKEPVVVVMPAMPVRETPMALPVDDPALPSPVEPVVVEPAAAPAPARAPPRALKAERQDLDDARTLIQDGRPAKALTALDRHQRNYPHGQLGEERDALRVLALSKAGKLDQARAAAALFSRRHPGSMLQGSVDAAITSSR